MKRIFLGAALLAVIGCGLASAAQQAPQQSVEALLYSSMPSTAAHRPEMAMDGDTSTYFRSAYGMGDGDEFRVVLSQPVPVKSIKIVTGDADGQDALTAGFVETSADGVQFARAGAFDAMGVADTMLDGRPVEALRIRIDRRRGVPALVIREITIGTSARIAHVQVGPGRGFVDISEAPDLAVWAAKAETQMEEFWPDTAALLYTDRFITPNMVNVVYRTGPGVTAVAATGGGVMTVNSLWCRQHPEDTGLTVHETAHVIQAFVAYNPVWLVEGIADYIRWIRFEPENYHARINTGTATYHDSYRTTAAFLGWLEQHYDSCLVTKLNKDVRFGRYTNDRFKQYCGKDVDTLWNEFKAAYTADPVHFLVPALAPADRPRTLPIVRPGSSVPVDLTGAYNLNGLSNDAAPFAETGGFDDGGAAYSSTLLGASRTWKDVLFRFGRANVPDAVICRGQTIALPAGAYESLWLLGSAVEGSQMAQKFVVTYTDGTSDELAQNISDWYVPQGFPGESRAVKTEYRNMASGVRDPRVFYLYSYGFTLNGAKSVRSITLPKNANVRLVAITLAR